MSGEMTEVYDGTKLFCNQETSENDRAACVIVHGLCEHQGRYDYLAQKMHEAGIGTYRFDHRGHGQSEGECAFVNNYDEMLDDVNFFVGKALSENPFKPVFLLGHSMGGFAVSLYGAKYPDKYLRGIITSGALTEDSGGLIAGIPKGLDVHMQLPNQLGSGVCSVKEVTDWYEKDPLNRKSFSAGLAYAISDGIRWFGENKKDFAFPVLMMHGENDGLVNRQDTIDFFNAAASKDKQMKIYGNCCHEIFNEWCRDEVIADAIRWMENRI